MLCLSLLTGTLLVQLLERVRLQTLAAFHRLNQLFSVLDASVVVLKPIAYSYLR